jgi:hypothetical protein
LERILECSSVRVDAYCARARFAAYACTWAMHTWVMHTRNDCVCIACTLSACTFASHASASSTRMDGGGGVPLRPRPANYRYYNGISVKKECYNRRFLVKRSPHGLAAFEGFLRPYTKNKLVNNMLCPKPPPKTLHHGPQLLKFLNNPTKHPPKIDFLEGKKRV